MADIDLSALSERIADLAEAAAPLAIRVDGTHREVSGFHWKDGLYVAAEECIEADDEVAVTLASGACAKAAVRGRDPSTGIVLVKPEQEAAPAEFARAASLRAGSLVLVVGRGASPLVAFGVASEVGPAWRSMRGGLIDARINLAVPVNGRFEGGAVLDATGALAGMMLFGPRRRPLVIPASTIDRIAPVLADRGHVARGFLGAGLHPMRRAGVDGAMVMSLEKGGPAETAGIKLGDIVTSWNGEAISGPRDMIRRLGPDSAGADVALGVLRAGEAHTINVTIGSRPLA